MQEKVFLRFVIDSQKYLSDNDNLITSDYISMKLDIKEELISELLKSLAIMGYVEFAQWKNNLKIKDFTIPNWEELPINLN